MTWSVRAIGRVKAVRESLQKQFDALPTESGKEEVVKKLVRESLDSALDAQDPESAIDVLAYRDGYKDEGGAEILNSLHILIEPKYGFVE
jgi:hypothetical protein